MSQLSTNQFQSIKAVFFDADDTIFTVHPSVAFHYNRVLSNYGYTVTDEAMKEIIKKCWQAHLDDYENRSQGYATSLSREKELWIRYATRVVSAVTNNNHAEEIPLRIYETFSRGETRQILPGFLDVLNSLKQKGVYVGVLTNNDLRTHTVLKDLGIYELFDVVLTAGEIGYKKPAREAYEFLLTRSGSLPHESLFIGDSFEHDCVGARDAGWNTIWLNSHGRANQSEDIKTIRSFSEFSEAVPDLAAK